MTDRTSLPPRRWGDLGARTGSGLVLVAVAIISALLGGPIFAMAWFIAATFVLSEWLQLPGDRRRPFAFAAGALVLAAIAMLAGVDLAWALAALAAGIVAQVALGPWPRWWAAAGQIYAGAFLLALVTLRASDPYGSRSIFWLFATVWSTDVFAYFGGRLIGGPKLWPSVSPSKTWSGTLVGLAAGASLGTVAATLGLPGVRGVGQIFALSLATATLAQAGDAFESALKRHFGVKDSGHVIPGHGGVMDRLDGFIAAAVFAFVVGELRRPGSVASGLFVWA